MSRIEMETRNDNMVAVYKRNNVPEVAIEVTKTSDGSGEYDVVTFIPSGGTYGTERCKLLEGRWSFGSIWRGKLSGNKREREVEIAGRAMEMANEYGSTGKR